MDLTPKQKEQFLNTLFEYYDHNGRHELPWRRTTNPYHIVVSELMLQQTQVGRVIPKYRQFVERFPDVTSLASAALADVLIAWQGLGYNRRAQYLWRAAQMVQDEYGGKFPDTLPGLVSLPGIGPNTAGAVMAYAFNKPAVFVETNVRTVIIHHFFKDRENILDTEILHILKQLEQGTSPRIFYWALMDYGTHLKQTVGNNISKSKHYVRQSDFAGSRRQLRGAVIRNLSAGPKKEASLLESVADERLPNVLDDLIREQLIVRRGETLELA